jgi:hypothetical protein
VRVEWEKTVPVAGAVHDVGMFGTPHTACKPQTQRWRETVDRLKRVFGFE